MFLVHIPPKENAVKDCSKEPRPSSSKCSDAENPGDFFLAYEAYDVRVLDFPPPLF